MIVHTCLEGWQEIWSSPLAEELGRAQHQLPLEARQPQQLVGLVLLGWEAMTVKIQCYILEKAQSARSSGHYLGDMLFGSTSMELESLDPICT